MTQETIAQQESAMLVQDFVAGFAAFLTAPPAEGLPIVGSIYRHTWPGAPGQTKESLDFEVQGTALGFHSLDRSVILKELETGQLWACPWAWWTMKRQGGIPVWRLVSDPRDPKPEDLGGGC